MIIYSAPWKIGGYGLGNLMLQQSLALYDAGLLKKIYCKNNAQSLIPKRFIKEIKSESDIDFDRSAAKILRYDILGEIGDRDKSFMGSRTLHQQQMLRKLENYSGKILKYCGSTYPTVQNSIMEYEKLVQSRAGIQVSPTDYASLRYGILECEEVDAFSCASNLVKQTFLASGFDEKKLSVISLGVDTDIFFPERKSVKDRFRIGFSATNPIRKGLVYLFNEFIKYEIPEKELHLRTNVLIDHPRVLNYPYLDTMKALYDNIDIFILPSSEDGFGMTVLESMACGVPVVTTKMTGASELIEHGVNGFVYNTPQECCAAIPQLYKDHKEHISDIGDRARKTAEKYTWEVYRGNFAKWVEEQINN